MTGYEATTIGQAFDASFDAAEGKACETEKGGRIVEINGKVSQKLHDAFVAFMKANYSMENIFNGAMLSGYPSPSSIINTFHLAGLRPCFDRVAKAALTYTYSIN